MYCKTCKNTRPFSRTGDWRGPLEFVRIAKYQCPLQFVGVVKQVTILFKLLNKYQYFVYLVKSVYTVHGRLFDIVA